ncbi:MAG: helix-turn-helix domain-containing protein [Anaerolineae bacterium]
MPDDFNPTEWITTKEAAELTGYNVRYLRQLVNEGKIRAVKRAGAFFIDKRSAMAYADEMKRLGSAKHDPWRIGARQRVGN